LQIIPQCQVPEVLAVAEPTVVAAEVAEVVDLQQVVIQHHHQVHQVAVVQVELLHQTVEMDQMHQMVVMLGVEVVPVEAVVEAVAVVEKVVDC
jgi:hypothetical protein